MALELRSTPPSMRVHQTALVGLTLVELLVAMAILVVVASSTLLIFRSITRAWRTGELRTERYQQARLLFDLFERELSSCVANARYPLIGVPAGDRAPLRQDSVGQQLFFVGTLPGRTGFIERGYWLAAEGRLMCHDDESGDGDYTTGQSEICGHDVSQFQVSFFDGSQWLDQWDGRVRPAPSALLPKAIHLVLTIGRQKPERFDTIIYVPTS